MTIEFKKQLSETDPVGIRYAKMHGCAWMVYVLQAFK